ncbi:MAG TPA: cytochrome c, partial [Steroidobacteraceae bacterium]
MNGHRALVLLVLLTVCSPTAHSDTPGQMPSSMGEALFRGHCESCHSRFLGSRAPSRQMLARYPPRAIIQALTTGLMRVQGYSLSGDQRRAIAEYVSGVPYQNDLAGESRGRCASNP